MCVAALENWRYRYRTAALASYVPTDVLVSFTVCPTYRTELTRPTDVSHTVTSSWS